MSIKKLEGNVEKSKKALEAAEAFHQENIAKATSQNATAGELTTNIGSAIYEGQDYKKLAKDIVSAEAEAVALAVMVQHSKKALEDIKLAHRKNARELGKAQIDECVKEGKEKFKNLAAAWEQVEDAIEDINDTYTAANKVFMSSGLYERWDDVSMSEASRYETKVHGIRNITGHSVRGLKKFKTQLANSGIK